MTSPCQYPSRGEPDDAVAKLGAEYVGSVLKQAGEGVTQPPVFCR